MSAAEPTYAVSIMRWDLWVDFMRTDGDGLTHASVRNVSPGISLGVGSHVVVGNEDADPAVARVVSIDDGVVLVAVLPGPVAAHESLLRDQPATT